MNKNQFAAILPLKITLLLEQIAKNMSVSEDKAIELLYNSSLYSYLEREETKLWYYSPELLFDLYIQGRDTGTIIFPEN